ncbi:Signal recognition particle receptor FtsY [uncultured archaeon]|nr:Signal recognition particle receptor FtsY [uncultured archaeon]
MAAPPVQKKSFIESIFGGKKDVPKPVPAVEAKREAPKPVSPKQKPQAREEAKPIPVQTTPPKQKEEIKHEAKPTAPSFKEEPQIALPPAHDLSGVGKKSASEHHAMAPKIGIGTAIKSFFSSEITIGEAEVNDLLEELELSLLEADVAYDVSLEVTQQLRTTLVGMKVPKGEVEKRTKEAIQGILEGVMDSDRKFDFLERVKAAERPVKILFVGPNGAGKTTTIAKIARKLMDNGLTVIFSASDTFRAAAIEQTEVHGERLGVKVIKSKYGADPASVAFDAVNHARSNNIYRQPIDSAGRQDTNANLLSELKKINRVAKPDIKLYVGESIGGNALLEQIKAFNEAIGVDGAILTKIDCDAKGGTAISISKSTGIPIIFLGIGQRYEDLIPFDAHKIAQEIMT